MQAGRGEARRGSPGRGAGRRASCTLFISLCKAARGRGKTSCVEFISSLSYVGTLFVLISVQRAPDALKDQDEMRADDSNFV